MFIQNLILRAAQRIHEVGSPEGPQTTFSMKKRLLFYVLAGLQGRSARIALKIAAMERA